MDFSLSSLAAGFVFGVLGFYVLKRGRHHGDPRRIGIGVALIAYSYFVSNPFLLWGIGIGLVWVAYQMRDFG